MKRRRKLRKDSKLHGRLEEVAALYEAGKSTTEIAAMFGLDPSNVFRILRSHGFTLRNRSDAARNALKTGRVKPRSGKDNPSWQGGRARHSEGYVLTKSPGHQRVDARGYVPEHVLVAERMLGRPLLRDEVVHHVNGVRDDNRPENLRVMNAAGHKRFHAQSLGGRIGVNNSGRKAGTRT